MRPDLLAACPATICPDTIERQTLERKTVWPKNMFAVSALVMFLAGPLSAHHLKKGETATLPVTTSSARARSLYEEGVADY